MADLHGSHAGINKAMDLARTCVYWPSMEADMTDYIKWCLTCIKCSNLPVKMLKPHEVPRRPWVKIGVDFFQDHFGKKHLMVADYFSKFPYVFLVTSDSFQDHQKESIYIRSGRDSLNFKKNRKNTLTKPTEPKIYAFSKSRNKSSSFTTRHRPH